MTASIATTTLCSRRLCGRRSNRGDVDMDVVNDVHLVGRVSAEPVQRELPSGDQLVTVRVVVPRPPVAKPAEGRRPPSVDTIEVACFTGPTRRSAESVGADEVVEVWGALRRRFFRTGAAVQSRYEVEAIRLKRVKRKVEPAA
jgi:single-strand DNA-binding protein